MTNTVDKNLLDIQKIRELFPALNQQINGKPLVYLDNAATTHRPLLVLKAVEEFYRFENSNVHRGVHTLSMRATEHFESAREAVCRFLNAQKQQEIIFTKGCTEAINLVAHSYARSILKPGDEILLSGMEHHSNIVPWQLACEVTGAKIKAIPVLPTGELDMESFERLLSEKTKIVGIVHVSNALGLINPVSEIIKKAHAVGAKVLLDGAQACAHISVDVQALDVDFYTVSGHKVFAPMGIGALYGKEDILDSMPPYQGGGDMIKTVSFEKTTYNDLPFKFEAGTPNAGGAIGLGAAFDFVTEVGEPQIRAYEQGLVDYALKHLQEVPGLNIVGSAKERVSVVSFVMENVHPHDIGTIVDQEGIALRTGHHCCMPLMKSLGLAATARASMSMYNTEAEIDRLINALLSVRRILT